MSLRIEENFKCIAYQIAIETYGLHTIWKHLNEAIFSSINDILLIEKRTYTQISPFFIWFIHTISSGGYTIN